ncbi:MAG TPA: hypothetical protein VFS87_03625 [Qipengyuania sp.]|nr:hypothetical protein [Qipengyuania sp.]
MTGDLLVQLIAIFGSLVLVTSGLAAHRLSWSKGVRLGLIWAGLFVIVTLFISIVTGQ